MRKIAIIEDGYVRDAQIYCGVPDNVGKGNREDDFRDLKYTCHYLGIFEGESDDEILKKAAKVAGVHPGIISLVDI